MHACDLSRPPIKLARDAVRQPPLSVTSHDPDPPAVEDDGRLRSQSAEGK